MWQIYYTPQTVAEVIDLLAEHREEGPRLMAGGTDLIVEIERGYHSPKVVIDISRLTGLNTITQDEQNNIHLGPLVTHNQVVDSPLCKRRAFPLVKACWEVGSPQIRNRGTVAGNLVTASPANDTITALYALRATLTLQSVRGIRTVKIEEFFQGVRKTVIEPDELLIDIAFPFLTQYEVGTFMKLGLRRAQAISVVNVAVVLTMFTDTITGARIALGSVAPTIVRANNAERYLTGKVMTEDVIAHASSLATQSIMPIGDVRGSAEYRTYMVETLTRHALQSLMEGTETDMLPPKPIMLWGKTQGRFHPGHSGSTVHTEQKDEPIITTVNGKKHVIQGANHKTLLRMLRENLSLTGTKEGCGEGECGACTVIMDGIAVDSCLVPAPRAHGSEIITIEGLADGDTLHPLQDAFIDKGAVQCGYCIPGFLMSGASLMEERKRPSHDEIRQAITGNLCRCTGYYKILQAFEKAIDLKY